MTTTIKQPSRNPDSTQFEQVYCNSLELIRRCTKHFAYDVFTGASFAESYRQHQNDWWLIASPAELHVNPFAKINPVLKYPDIDIHNFYWLNKFEPEELELDPWEINPCEAAEITEVAQQGDTYDVVEHSSAKVISESISTLKQLLEEEDTDDLQLRPTRSSLETAILFLIDAYSKLGDSLLKPSVASDGEGGIRLGWINDGRDLRLLIYGTDDRDPSIYHQDENGQYKIERNATTGIFLQWLLWLTNDERVVTSRAA